VRHLSGIQGSWGKNGTFHEIEAVIMENWKMQTKNKLHISEHQKQVSMIKEHEI